MFDFPAAPLRSERLLIRRIEKSDLTQLYAVYSVEAVNRYLPYDTWQSDRDAQDWWGRVEEMTASGSALQFVICCAESGVAIGTGILFAHDAEHGRAEIGYAIGQAHWGKGLAREAVQCMLHYAFTDLDLRRIEARVDARNSASSNLLLQLGFSAEGCLRQWQEAVNLELYGLLREEWPALSPKD